MLRLLMISVAIILMTLIVTQVLKPVYKGEQLFPMFRRSRLHEAEAELARLEADKKVKTIEAKALRLELENQALANEVLDEFIDDDYEEKKRKL